MKSSNDYSLQNNNETIERVNEVSLLFADYISREFDRIGMRFSYRHILKPLVENEGMTQLDLVHLTHLKAPTISITLRNMEKEGIVRREKSDNDRRETHVFITDKGRRMHQKVMAALDKAEKAMLNDISENEVMNMCGTLDKITENLRNLMNESFGEVNKSYRSEKGSLLVE